MPRGNKLHPAEETPVLPVSPLRRELLCTSVGEPFAGQVILIAYQAQEILCCYHSFGCGQLQGEQMSE